MEAIKKAFSWDEVQSSHRLMLLIILALGLLNFFWGEKVPAGGGFGWDGVQYAKMVRNLDTMISDGQLSSYYTQRILPSAIVRGMLLFSGVSINDANIIRSFELYNLTLLVVACWAWKRIANKFLLSIAGRWIGFSAIFINFQASKQAFYYPVLTDVTALLVAMLLLLFYSEKKPIALFLVTIIGAFCWPVVSLCGAFLLIFLRSELPQNVIRPASSTFYIKSVGLPYFMKMGGVLILSLAVLGYLALKQFTPVSEHACVGFNDQLQTFVNATPPSISAFLERMLISERTCSLEKVVTKTQQFLTALPSLFGLLVGLAILVGSPSFFKAIVSNLRTARFSLLALAVAAILLPAFIVNIVSNPNIANPSSLLLLIWLILFPQEGKFLLPVVSLVVFWGPVVLLLVLYWKEFCVQARKLGPGVVAVIGTTLILGVVGEPRFMTIAWPFLVLGLVLVLDASKTKASFKYLFIFLTVIYAQFWMKINVAPWLSPDGEGLQDFPKQLYFMHYGLWMSWLTYLVQLPIIIISAFLLKNSIAKINNQ